MEEIQKLLNPWALHFQKLGLELKCPKCLNLLNNPRLLPCNHIFCDICIPRSTRFGLDCLVCNNKSTDGDVRTIPFVEKLVSIYQSLDSTFAKISLQILSCEQALLDVIPPSAGKLKKEPNEALEVGVTNGATTTGKAAVLSNVCNKDQLQPCGKNGSDELLETEELDMNQAPQLSPESPPSVGDVKFMDGNTSAKGSKFGASKKHETKSKTEGCTFNTTEGHMEQRTIQKGISYTRDAKRQKMLDYGSSAAVAMGDGLLQNVDPSTNGEISSRNLAENPEAQPGIALPRPVSNSSDMWKSVCAFCHSSKQTDVTGPMLYYADRKEVYAEKSMLSNVIPVHSKCIEWTPQIYFEGETIKNLESELGRASKLKCSSCGKKGAALGCFAKSCRKTYHVPCAVEIPECRWDCEDFLMLCPSHNSFKFPREKSKCEKQSKSNELFWATSASGQKEWVFCGSALSSEEKIVLLQFATMCGATVSKHWEPNVTHVIAATNDKGACTRTLKVLMGILNGRWILTMDWIKACTKANHPVNEEPYEVNLDNHGCLDGPKTGRLRISNNEPKLFDGLKFYFSGDFVPAYKIDLLNLVRTGGGTILESVEQLMVQSRAQITFQESLVIYNSDATRACAIGEENSIVSRRLQEAAIVAKGINSPVVRHTWILESIAGCKLLPLPC